MYRYDYTSLGGLVNYVAKPGLRPDTQAPWQTRSYHYETSDRVALTGISLDGSRYSEYAYHANKQVKESGLADDVQKLRFTYGGTGTGSAKTTFTEITNNRNAVTRYDFKNVNDEQRLHRVSLRGVSGCPAVSAETGYDVNGFIDYEMDFQGNKTDYTYTPAGQLLDVTRGINPVLPGRERLTKIEWNAADNQIKAVRTYGATISDPVLDVELAYYVAPHAAARRPMTIGLSNRTAFGVPNQLRQFALSYTFHPNNMVQTISVDGLRPGTADTTVRTFNSYGDLISVRDALGNTIAYSGHNMLGLPASVTDGNGLVTSLVYNEIGQATHVIRKHPLGDRVTKLEYHFLGMVSRLDRPDGSIRHSGFHPTGLPIFTPAIRRASR